MTNLKISLPKFEGFYNSLLDISEYIDVSEDDGIITQDEFDDIDWQKTEENVGRWYLDAYIEENKEVLNEIGASLEFKKIDSPREYNFRTDELICEATIDMDVFIKRSLDVLRDRFHECKEIFIRKHRSRSGFISFYSDDIGYWIRNLIHPEMDNIVFETLLECLTIDTDVREFIEYGIENYYEMIEYIS